MSQQIVTKKMRKASRKASQEHRYRRRTGAPFTFSIPAQHTHTMGMAILAFMFGLGRKKG